MKHIILHIALLLPFYIFTAESPEQRLTVTNKHACAVNIWYTPKGSSEGFVTIINIGPSKSEKLLPLNKNTILITAEDSDDKRVTIAPTDTELILTDNKAYNLDNTKIIFMMPNEEKSCLQQ